MGPSIVDYMEETLTQEFKSTFCDEVWAINMAANLVWHDVVFWMDDLVDQYKFKPLLIEALNKRNRPVITSTRRPEIVRNSYDYPISDVVKLCGPFGKPYLNNGVAMAIAYAIHIGVKTLKIYGADFSYPNRDYAESGRACVECWITLATTRNIKIFLPKRTSLLDAVKSEGIYGYKEQPVVLLNNGGAAQYRPAENQPAYRPEDSSGIPPEQTGKPNGLDIQPSVP